MMCAFMTPVLKNDWEIYKTKTKRSRNNSESSAVSAPPSHRSRPPHSRRRGIGDTGRSFSYHAPSMHHRGDMMLAGSPPRAYHMSTKNSRCASRTSMEPHSPGTTSPPVSPLATNSSNGMPRQSPPKSPSSGSLSKFHNKVMDKLKTVLHLKENHHEDEEQQQEDTRGQS
ncbi:hypothetical protein O3P69_000358 [Scylla paramamosain]|uniref:Uncharacterized protein n=1 Tax=Scylla paramamosain TaxID=85552 RepID=A0AAW0UWF3_SCYPA